MPRFFNRIRKQLAKENKFFQYSRYAIGEILLVVIGILIALQVDSWNEEKKSRAKIDSILDKVFRELESNIDETTELFQVTEKRDSLRHMVVMDKITLEDLKSYDNPDWNEIFEINVTYKTVSLSQKGYDQLMENIDNVPQEYSGLVDELVILYETHKRKVWEEQEILFAAEKENYRNRAELEFYQNKYNLVLLANNKSFQDYILNDSGFKAETIHWIEAVKAQLIFAQIYRTQALKCYEMIASELGLESKSSKWKIDDEFIDSFEGEYITSWGESIVQTVKDGYPYVQWGKDSPEYMTHKVNENTYYFDNFYMNYQVKNDSVFIYSPRFNYIGDKGWLATKILD